jgi:hypothetical protein
VQPRRGGSDNYEVGIALSIEVTDRLDVPVEGHCAKVQNIGVGGSVVAVSLRELLRWKKAGNVVSRPFRIFLVVHFQRFHLLNCRRWFFACGSSNADSSELQSWLNLTIHLLQFDF